MPHGYFVHYRQPEVEIDKAAWQTKKHGMSNNMAKSEMVKSSMAKSAHCHLAYFENQGLKWTKWQTVVCPPPHSILHCVDYQL